MLIQKILEGDKLNCCHALEADDLIKQLDEEFYSLLSKCPNEIYFDMERTVNEYIDRVTQITYLQGLKDFADLYITLNEDIHEILQKYE